MKKILKSIIACMLALSMLLCATVPAFAVGTEEEYICELRLIYAEDYEEARQILADSEFSDYKVLNENLNKNSGEIGVWLAYKTTTDIEDAITDLAIMQMNGGYTEGNYQELIKQSYNEYVAMGEIYLYAINYFVEAYDAGDYLAEIAYRQLNFYNVVSDGIPEDKIPDFEGERLGDIFYDGIDEYELATMFLQGNSYALGSIRSLIAMGVSYNEDGKTYLEKVGEAAAEMTAASDVYDNEDYDALAESIASSIDGFRQMFKELATVEAELDYTDDTMTDLEIAYLEYMAVAEMMRGVDYLDGKTLYQFCLDYKLDESDYSSLYPLVAALNEGQQAMTRVSHYYDVVRYSVSTYSEDVIEEKLSEMEEKYGAYPFNVYTGVDRSMYYGTFAITSAASRADAYTDQAGISEAFFGEGNLTSTVVNVVTGVVGAGIFAGAFGVAADIAPVTTASVASKTEAAVNALSTEMTLAKINGYLNMYSYDEFVTNLVNTHMVHTNQLTDITSWSFSQKVAYLDSKFQDLIALRQVDANTLVTYKAIISKDAAQAQDTVMNTAQTAMLKTQLLAGAMYIVGGAMMIYSAFNILSTIYYYYNPKYDDIPTAMVDLIETVDGDRYIKYDVVFEAETRDDGNYSAGDLNAFEGQRWNALYYTKSYEAGKPLLADEFVVSYTNNQPAEGYAPVHRFGEVVGYDLNKYNFDGDTGIYLSVKQSKNNKSAVADVPEVVGSVFSTGYLFLAGGIGAAIGVGGSVITHGLVKKKRSKTPVEN